MADVTGRETTPLPPGCAGRTACPPQSHYSGSCLPLSQVHVPGLPLHPLLAPVYFLLGRRDSGKHRTTAGHGWSRKATQRLSLQTRGPCRKAGAGRLCFGTVPRRPVCLLISLDRADCEGLLDKTWPAQSSQAERRITAWGRGLAAATAAGAPALEPPGAGSRGFGFLCY